MACTERTTLRFVRTRKDGGSAMRTFKALRGVALAACVAVWLMAVVASGALAAAPIYECVPAKYGAAVTAGNASGECKPSKKTTYTPVALPSSAEEQQKLLAILPYLKYVASGVGEKPTIQVSGANVQIVNGEGKTATTNGAGNLIIGYDELVSPEGEEEPAIQTGSHDLVVGRFNSYTSYGSVVAGQSNQALGPESDVFGGGNQATAFESSVTGGSANTASALVASVSGGEDNQASGERASVSGGLSNTAGDGGWVGGGEDNTVSAADASVSGGLTNTAAFTWSSIFGGKDLTTKAEFEALP